MAELGRRSGTEDQEAVKEYQEILHNDIISVLQILPVRELFLSSGCSWKQYANSRGVQIIVVICHCMWRQTADVWAHREMFYLNRDGRPNVVAGAAPDAFSESGQVRAVRYMTERHGSYDGLCMVEGKNALKSWNYLM